MSVKLDLDLDLNQSREVKKERNNDENTSLVWTGFTFNFSLTDLRGHEISEKEVFVGRTIL